MGVVKLKTGIPSVGEDVATPSLPVAEALLNLILSVFVLSALALRDGAINIRSLSGISA